MIYTCNSILLFSLKKKGHFDIHYSIDGGFTSLVVRESFPRQVDKKSRGPQGERSGILKEEERTNILLFFPLHSLGIYNNDVSCLRIVSGLNLLANSVILKCKLWE